MSGDLDNFRKIVQRLDEVIIEFERFDDKFNSSGDKLQEQMNSITSLASKINSTALKFDSINEKQEDIVKLYNNEEQKLLNFQSSIKATGELIQKAYLDNGKDARGYFNELNIKLIIEMEKVHKSFLNEIENIGFDELESNIQNVLDKKIKEIDEASFKVNSASRDLQDANNFLHIYVEDIKVIKSEWNNMRIALFAGGGFVAGGIVIGGLVALFT